MSTAHESETEDELNLAQEIRDFINKLQQADAVLHAEFKDVLSAGARYLEEGLHNTETQSAQAGGYTAQARGARDKAELAARVIKSDAERATKARERAEAAASATEAAAAAVASASASAVANANAGGGAGTGQAGQPCEGYEAGPPRQADPLVATMGQLSTLLIGSSPAFANAMRLQTDAVASGMGNLNAIANQQAHYTLDLAATARAVAEAYSANKKADMHFHLAVSEAPPAPAPAPAKK